MADDTLLAMKGLVIEATSYPPGEPPKNVTLVHGVDLNLKRGKVLGLIGESGAGKSTIGLSAMSFGRGGVRLTGGTIHLNGREIRLADAKTLRALRGREVTYVSQSAIASFNPAKQVSVSSIWANPINTYMNVRTYSIFPDDIYSIAEDRLIRFRDAGYAAIAWHPHESLLAIATPQDIQIFDPEIENAVATLSQADVVRLDWSPDGEYIAGGLLDGSIRLWELP